MTTNNLICRTVNCVNVFRVLYIQFYIINPSHSLWTSMLHVPGPFWVTSGPQCQSSTRSPANLLTVVGLATCEAAVLPVACQVVVDASSVLLPCWWATTAELLPAGRRSLGCSEGLLVKSAQMLSSSSVQLGWLCIS